MGFSHKNKLVFSINRCRINKSMCNSRDIETYGCLEEHLCQSVDRCQRQRINLGRRLSQFKNGVTTQYTLDLNAGLTQALQDGANTYLSAETLPHRPSSRGALPEVWENT
jgi:hypothetical protein